MLARFQIRRGTAAEWADVNPVLHKGEPGLETDTTKVKIGDGVTRWNDLDYSAALNLASVVAQSLSVETAARISADAALSVRIDAISGTGGGSGSVTSA